MVGLALPLLGFRLLTFAPGVFASPFFCVVPVALACSGFSPTNSTSGVNDACIAVRAPCACTRKWWCRLAAAWQLGASPNAARSSLGRAAHCREPGVHVQGNPGNEWKCIFAEHTSPFIKTPIFPLQVCRVLIRGVLANQGGEQPIDSSVAGVSRAATSALGPPPLASLKFA